MTAKKPIWYIYGSGGLGLETMDILTKNIRSKTVEDHECMFIVDNVTDRQFNGFQVVDFQEAVVGSKITIAVGEPKTRNVLREKIENKNLVLSSIISDTAFVSDSATIARGAIIAPFASIQAQAIIGENVAVNTQAIIGHHVELLDGSVISSQVNLGGACHVGEQSYVGMGALIREKVLIGSQSIVGMGSVVYRDIPDGVIALGNPARVAKKNEDKKVF